MDWHGLTWIGIDYPAFQTKLSVRGMCLKKPGFVCYHPDCQEPLVIFERWGGLLKHNNKDHRNRSGFVDSRQLAMFDTTKLLATSVAFA